MRDAVPPAVAAVETAAVVAELRDRVEIADTLYRYGLGLDLKDWEQFASALSPDAQLDFRPAAASWGGRPPLLSGRDTIVTMLLGMFAGRVDTGHHFGNERITVDGDTATLSALVEAQHLLTADPSVRALLKNRYDVALVRDGRRWVISAIRVENVWFTGDPGAIFD